MPIDAAEYSAALRQYAAGVALMTVRDGIDDVGTTVTSVTSVSAAPPLVASRGVQGRTSASPST